MTTGLDGMDLAVPVGPPHLKYQMRSRDEFTLHSCCVRKLLRASLDVIIFPCNHPCSLTTGLGACCFDWLHTGMKVNGEEDQLKKLQAGEIQVAVMIGIEMTVVVREMIAVI